MTAFSFLLAAVGLVGSFSNGEDARRPYEMVWAGRTADTREPTLPMTDAAGWRVVASNAVGAVTTGKDHLLFGGGVVRLSYRATGPEPSVGIRPAEPLPVAEGADTLTVWVYGNTHGGYAPNPPGTPTPWLYADFTDAAGKPLSMKVASLAFTEWNKLFLRLKPADRERLGRGATFDGFTVTRGTNTTESVLEFTSFSLYREELNPLAFKARPKRGYEIFPGVASGINTGDGKLPFPNTPNTIVPPCAAPDPEIEFDFPSAGSADFGDFRVRVRGGQWIRFAQGGGIYPVSARKGAQVKVRRIGDSLVADILAPTGVEEVRFGSLDVPASWKTFCEPYLKYGYQKPRPQVLATEVGGKPLFHLAMFDWTQSNAAEPFAVKPDGRTSNGGVRYPKKTDGSRNVCVERFVWSFSATHDGVLPNIPHDPSPYRRVTGSNCWHVCFVQTNRFDDLAYWFGVRKRGIRHLVIRDHEPMWRDGNESFTFRTCAAPKKGGDLMEKMYARAMIDGLGFFYGPYNNYTDLAPVNRYWHENNVVRTADGGLLETWERCYSPKSVWAVSACEEIIPIIQEKFHFNSAYCDVHTAVAPWSRTDYDARVPGSGSLSQVYYNYGEIMLLQKKTWGGPVYSEGQHHFFYTGLTDGDYAQDRDYGFITEPWLVEIDLRRMHPLTGGGFGLGRPTMGLFGKDCSDRFLAATVAFGHPGFFCEGSEANEDRSYFMVQAIAAKYTQANAKDIAYFGEGRWMTPSEAILRDAHRENQLRVTYDDGTIVYVNGSTNQTLAATIAGESRVLPPNGLWARSEDGSVESYIGEDESGCRIRHAHGPEYVYDEKNGKRTIRLK